MTGNVNQFGTLNFHQSMTAEVTIATQMNKSGQFSGLNSVIRTSSRRRDPDAFRRERKTTGGEPRTPQFRGPPPGFCPGVLGSAAGLGGAADGLADGVEGLVGGGA